MSFFHLLESLFTCFLKDKTLHNHWDYAGFTVPIITYQVITGNYSYTYLLRYDNFIITYQVITGNYSYNVLWESSDNILKKYKWKRKSLAITPSDVNIFSQTSETLNGTAFKNIISQSQKNNTLNKRDHI